MVKLFSALACGILFAAGLSVSGMTRPTKVLDFLNLFGNWDPSLIFVLGGAVTMYFIFNRPILKRTKPLFEEDFKLPMLKKVDPNLIAGALIFGIGWGLSGVCPGPAMTSLPAGTDYIFFFTIAMLAGMWAANAYLKKTKKTR